MKNEVMPGLKTLVEKKEIEKFSSSKNETKEWKEEEIWLELFGKAKEKNQIEIILDHDKVASLLGVPEYELERFESFVLERKDKKLTEDFLDELYGEFLPRKYSGILTEYAFNEIEKGKIFYGSRFKKGTRLTGSLDRKYSEWDGFDSVVKEYEKGRIKLPESGKDWIGGAWSGGL